MFFIFGPDTIATNLEKKMFYFKSLTGKKEASILMDGEHVEPLTLEGILIRISFNQNNEIQASFDDTDWDYVKSLSPANLLALAVLKATSFIDSKQFDKFFSSHWQNSVHDIVDERDQSYYLLQHPAYHLKNYQKISVKPLEPLDIIESVIIPRSYTEYKI